MRSLIWKDCRLNSWVLMLGVATWLGPYIVGVLWLMLGRWPTVANGLRWAFMLAPASVISLEATMLPLLLLGANAIARERADRSAEFLAYLPSSRARSSPAKPRFRSCSQPWSGPHTSSRHPSWYLRSATGGRGYRLACPGVSLPPG